MGPTYAETAAFQHEVDGEAEVARSAQRIFTLTRFMADELVRRGVNRERIDLVPNGYSGPLPPWTGRVRSAGAAWAAARGWTVGYIGSFSAYEGLEDLVWACAILRREGLPVNLRLVGASQASGLLQAEEACPVSLKLRDLARELGFEKGLTITGRVPPVALAEHYAALDLFVIPRKPLQVCELVSPIKPLEAAAYGVPLLCSNVAPLEEMAQEAGFALFNKGDREDLKRQIGQLLPATSQRQAMAEQGRHWVDTERRFEKLVQPMVEAFRQCPPRFGLRSRGNSP